MSNLYIVLKLIKPHCILIFSVTFGKLFEICSVNADDVARIAVSAQDSAIWSNTAFLSGIAVIT